MEKTPIEFTRLSELIYPFLDKMLKNSDQWFAFKLWQCWPELAQNDILKQSQPVSFQKGRLVLWVTHSVELMELSFQMEELKQKINSHFKKQWVKEIHFTVNKEILKKRQKSVQALSQIIPHKSGM